MSSTSPCDLEKNEVFTVKFEANIETNSKEAHVINMSETLPVNIHQINGDPLSNRKRGKVW